MILTNITEIIKKKNIYDKLIIPFSEGEWTEAIDA